MSSSAPSSPSRRWTNTAIADQCIIENISTIVPKEIVQDPPPDFEALKNFGRTYKCENEFYKALAAEIESIMQKEPQVYEIIFDVIQC